jgi:hypothetical protein
MRPLLNLVLGLTAVTLASCVPGQRLLTFEIELDGQTVFEGQRGVPDSTPVTTMWDELGSLPFNATADEEVTGHLAGKVVVRIKHVNNELDAVELKSLSLQSDAATSQWSIDPAEAERVKSEATK